jgi:hypothetical protein
VGSYILLSSLVPNICNLCSSIKVRYCVPLPCYTTCKIIVSENLLAIFYIAVFDLQSLVWYIAVFFVYLTSYFPTDV